MVRLVLRRRLSATASSSAASTYQLPPVPASVTLPAKPVSPAFNGASYAHEHHHTATGNETIAPIPSTSTITLDSSSSTAPPLTDNDLVSLRVAALQSKKRKEAQALALASVESSVKRGKRTAVLVPERDQDQSTIKEIDITEEGEIEEGEIGEQHPDFGQRLERGRGRYRDWNETDNDVVDMPPGEGYFSSERTLPASTEAMYRYPSLSSSTPDYPLHLIRAEAIQIIDEIFSYGVTPEYLVQNGVSEDIVVISLHELGYHVSNDFSQQLSSHLSDSNDRQYHQQQLKAPDSKPSSPHHHQPTSYISDIPLNPELTLLEAQHRQKLLDRKQAVAARNSQKASLLQSEFESMFSAEAFSSSASSSSSSTAITASTDASTSTLLPDLIPTPILSPLLPSLLPPSRSSSPPRIPVTSSSLTSGTRRPVAADFESRAVPRSIAALASSTARRHAGSFVSHDSTRATQLVIDLSDSEASDGEDEITKEAAEFRAKDGLHLGQSTVVPVAINPTSSEVSLQVLSAVAAGGSEAKHALEEKESEIRRIMEQITKMERNKRTRAVTPIAVAAAVDLSKDNVVDIAVAAPAIVNTTAQQEGATEEDDDNVVIANSHQAESGGKEAEADLQNPLGTGETAFTAYHSPFQLHPALRSQPLPALTSSSGTGGFFSTINLDDRSLSEAALASFVVKRRVIDPKKKLCVYDSGAGKCVDASCKSVHFKEFIPSEDDVIAFVKSNIRLADSNSTTKKALFEEGLTLSLASAKRPLTLTTALTSAINFWTNL